MKSKLSLPLLFVLGAISASAYDYTGTLNNLNIPIPDYDLNGIQSSQTVSGLGQNVTHVNVMLNILGGFNGDYFAYLYHNGVSAILLNRVGRSSTSTYGYPDAGFGPDSLANYFLFNDQSAYDIHTYRTVSYALNGSGQLMGQWQPDGRAIDPLSAGSVFDSASRSEMLNVFNGMDPNGIWSLYVSDVSILSAGTLQGWGLLLDVPEPSAGPLIALGLAGTLARRRRTISLV